MARVLILGGTAEARELAGRLAETGSFDTITSLAGRTRSALELPGTVRSGGFGGPGPMADYLREERIDAVIDATHPFAEMISAHAAEACAAAGTPRIVLVRAQWLFPKDGNWQEATSLVAAADLLPGLTSRVFLTVGRQGLDCFSGLDDIWFLVRLIEVMETPLPLADYQVLFRRPPYSLDEERAIMKDHAIDCLVAKNSGGPATEAKITAALEADIPIVLVQRPDPPPGERVERIDDCMAWLKEAL